MSGKRVVLTSHTKTVREVQKIVKQQTYTECNMGYPVSELLNNKDLSEARKNRLHTPPNKTQTRQKSPRMTQTKNKKKKKSQRMTQIKTRMTKKIHRKKGREIHVQTRQITRMKQKRSWWIILFTIRWPMRKPPERREGTNFVPS